MANVRTRPQPNGVASELAPESDLRIETTVVTPDLAQHWLAAYPYQGQRPVRNHRVTELATYMARGEFEVSEIVIAHVGDHGYLVNGQHRLHAVVESGMPQRMVLIRRILPDLDAVARVYATFDRPMKRSDADGFRASGLAADVGLTDRQVGKLSAIAAFVDAGFLRHVQAATYALRSVSRRSELVREWAPEARLYFDAISSAPRGVHQRLEGASVASVGIVTYRYQQESADAFWPVVAAGVGLEKDSPAYTLLRYLIDNIVMSSTMNRYTRAVAAAWNAHYADRTLSLIKVFDPASPMVIRGTPYDGKPR